MNDSETPSAGERSAPPAGSTLNEAIEHLRFCVDVLAAQVHEMEYNGVIQTHTSAGMVEKLQAFLSNAEHEPPRERKP
jgi:hypothetical protein